jgi:hypothetical protein
VGAGCAPGLLPRPPRVVDRGGGGTETLCCYLSEEDVANEMDREYFTYCGAASVASFQAAVLIEIYLCTVCSCQKKY